MTWTFKRLLCRLFHDRAGWPVGAQYRCTQCWLAWPVPWHPAHIPAYQTHRARHATKASALRILMLARYGKGAV